jgi:hypothetical protein
LNKLRKITPIKQVDRQITQNTNTRYVFFSTCAQQQTQKYMVMGPNGVCKRTLTVLKDSSKLPGQARPEDNSRNTEDGLIQLQFQFTQYLLESGTVSYLTTDFIVLI